MPAGLKSTSSPIQVSEFSIELVANTFVSEAIDLSLNPLDQEVFVIVAADLDPSPPFNSNVLASARREIICNAGMTPDGGIPFDREDPTFTALTEDYLGIIATSNCFLNLQGTNNGNVKQARVRIYGYRATASASVYAALVQSEVLSA